MTSRRPYWCPKQRNGGAMLVSQTSPVGVELFSYANAFSCIDVGHVSENTLLSAIV